MSLDDRWESYFQKCFPEPVPKVQETEMKKAFMAGCLETLSLIYKKCEEEPDDKIVEDYIAGLMNEARDFCVLTIEKDKTITEHN